MITFDDFLKVDIRLGKIIEVDDFPEARQPAYRLKVDLGQEIGLKKSCAQLPHNYTKDQLKNKLVLCVINFPPKQVGPALSEVLILGVPDENGHAILISPDQPVSGRLAALGSRLF